MLKKMKAAAEDVPVGTSKDLSKSVLESSRQIWLAGLGAFSRAQQEGRKVFDTLVQRGEALESKTKRSAIDTAAAAGTVAKAKAKEMQAMAGGTWDKLEQVFENRVARALGRLGVYSSEDVKRLTERVDALSEAVNALLKQQGVKRAPSDTPTAKKGKSAAKRGKTKASTARSVGRGSLP